MDMLEYCGICFGDDRPDIVELYRHRFAFAKTLPKQQYEMVKQVVAHCNGVTEKIGKHYGFSIPEQHYSNAVALLKQVPVTIHTLPEHLDVVRYCYSLKPHERPWSFITFSFGESWQYLDADSRIWEYLDIVSARGIRGVRVRDHDVLRCFNKGRLQHFKVMGNQLHRIEKRAAYDLAARHYSEINVYWLDFEHIWVIPTNSIRSIPDDIFVSLARMRPRLQYLPGLLTFYKKDYQLVKEFLRCIKVNLVSASRTVLLPGDVSKLAGTPVVSIESLDSRRIASVRAFILELGADSAVTTDSIKVTSSSDKFDIAFVVRSKQRSEFVDGVLYLPLQTIDGVASFLQAAESIVQRLNRKVSLLQVLAVCWRLITPSDNEFAKEIFVKYIDDKAFAIKFLTDAEKLEAIKDWYIDSMKEIESAPSDVVDLMRKVSRYLSSF